MITPANSVAEWSFLLCQLVILNEVGLPSWPRHVGYIFLHTSLSRGSKIRRHFNRVVLVFLRVKTFTLEKIDQSNMVEMSVGLLIHVGSWYCILVVLMYIYYAVRFRHEVEVYTLTGVYCSPILVYVLFLHLL